MDELVLIGFKPLIFKLNKLYPKQAPFGLRMNYQTATQEAEVELFGKKGIVQETWKVATPEGFQEFCSYTTKVLITPNPPSDGQVERD